MGLLMKNEKEANRIVAKVMGITFVIFTLVYILNLLGIFTVDSMIMTVSYIVSSLLLLAPSVLVRVVKEKVGVLKYINVIFASAFVILTSITLTFHVVVLYVYGIAIASLYFSKRLNVIATAISVIGVSVGQILAFLLQTLPDDNFSSLQKVIIFGVVPRALILIAIAAIFTMLCSRTASMLGNLMGAEEQKEMLEKISKMQEQNNKISKHLVDMVEELQKFTVISNESNQKIAQETVEMKRGTDENASQIGSMNSNIAKINEQMEELGNMSREIAISAKEINELSQKNQAIMDMASESMESIAESAKGSKEIVQTLGEASQEIISIIEVITGISNQTNILALNASIEAARAGEQGKGFAVVAGEIQKLSEQTKQAVENIGTIIHEVVENTEKTIVSMEESVVLTEQGVAQIKEAEDSTLKITKSNEVMSDRIQKMDKITVQVSESEKNVALGMEQINQNTAQNVEAVEEVAQATKESSQETRKLVEMVDQIKELSEQLSIG